MKTIQCSAPHCPRPSARADRWCSLAGFGLPGVAHEKCVRRLYKLRNRGAPLDTPRGRHTTPVPPCSSPDCEDPHGGKRVRNPSRPVRLRVEVDGVARPFCVRCGQRARQRLKRGTPVDAPLKGESGDGDEDTGPEPTPEEVEALFLTHKWELANRTINYLLRPPKPPPLDDLKDAEFGRAVVEAFDKRDHVAIYGDIEMYQEIR